MAPNDKYDRNRNGRKDFKKENNKFWDRSDKNMIYQKKNDNFKFMKKHGENDDAGISM